MNNTDFVYDSIYRGAMRKGANEKTAHNAAVTGLEDYKKGKYKKPVLLIADKISEAEKHSKITRTHRNGAKN